MNTHQYSPVKFEELRIELIKKNRINNLKFIISFLIACLAISCVFAGLLYYYQQVQQQKILAYADERLKQVLIKNNIPTDIQGQLVQGFVMIQFSELKQKPELKYMTLPSDLDNVQASVNNYLKNNKPISLNELSHDSVHVNKISENLYKAEWLSNNKIITATFNLTKGEEFNYNTQKTAWLNNGTGYYITSITF